MGSQVNDLLAVNSNLALQTLHGETVIYRPKYGGAQTLTAVVDRAPPQFIDQLGEIVSPLVTVRVTNCSLTGIPSADVNTGGDTMDVRVRMDGDLETRAVQHIVTTDGGVTVLAVR